MNPKLSFRILLGFLVLYNYPIIESFDFEKMTKTPYFVDQTDTLRIFFSQYEMDRHLVITAPRKFGKSTNLDMIKRFAQMEFNKTSGRRYLKSETSSFQLFTNKTLNLTISKYPDMIKQHLSEYPVIHFDMRCRVKSNEDIMKQLHILVYNMFKEHEWLIEKVHREDDSKCKERTTQIGNLNKALKKLFRPDEIIWCIRDLSIFLSQHFNKKVLILITDYDSLINDAIDNPALNVTQFYNTIGEMFQNAFNFPEFSNTVAYSVISGVSELPLRSNSANLRAIQFYRFLGMHNLAASHGFNDEQVYELFDRHGIPVSQRDLVKKTYNGYFIDRSQIRIYNPYSITSYLSDNNRTDKFPRYWTKTKPAKFLLKVLKAPEFRCRFVDLLHHEETHITLPSPCIVDEIQQVIKLAEENWQHFAEREYNLIFYFLYEQGYLSHTSQRRIYKIANSHVHDEMVYYLSKWYMTNANVTQQQYQSIGDQLYEMLKTNQGSSSNKLGSILKDAFHTIQGSKFSSTQLKEHDYRATVYSAVMRHPKIRIGGEIKATDINFQRPLPLLVIYNKHFDVLVMHLHYNLTAEKSLHEAKTYELQPSGKINSKKFLGINVGPDLKIDVILEDSSSTTSTL